MNEWRGYWPLWSESGRYERQRETKVSELSLEHSQSWRGTRCRVLLGRPSRRWQPSGRRSSRSPRTGGRTACSSSPCRPATCRSGAPGPPSLDRSSGCRTPTRCRTGGWCARKILWLQWKEAVIRGLLCLMLLTMQGVPLIGVQPRGDLSDGQQVILVHLPLQAGLLQQTIQWGAVRQLDWTCCSKWKHKEHSRHYSWKQPKWDMQWHLNKKCWN